MLAVCVRVDTEVDNVDVLAVRVNERVTLERVALDVVNVRIVRVALIVVKVRVVRVSVVRDSVVRVPVVRVSVVMVVVTLVDDEKDKHSDISSCKDSISVTSCRNSCGNCTRFCPSVSERHTFAIRPFSWKSLEHVFSTSVTPPRPSLHASSHLATASCSLVLPKQ